MYDENEIRTGLKNFTAKKIDTIFSDDHTKAEAILNAFEKYTEQFVRSFNFGVEARKSQEGDEMSGELRVSIEVLTHLVHEDNPGMDVYWLLDEVIFVFSKFEDVADVVDFLANGPVAYEN